MGRPYGQQVERILAILINAEGDYCYRVFSVFKMGGGYATPCVQDVFPQRLETNLNIAPTFKCRWIRFAVADGGECPCRTSLKGMIGFLTIKCTVFKLSFVHEYSLF